MARTKGQDDPFEDDWGPTEGTATPTDEMPEASVDPERAPFLKPFHLQSREGTLELLSVSGATEYSDAILHVQVGNKSFRIGLKNFDPSYVALRRKFGAKKADWKGTLRYRIMPHKGRADGFVAVRPT